MTQSHTAGPSQDKEYVSFSNPGSNNGEPKGEVRRIFSGSEGGKNQMTKSGFSERAKKLSQDNFNVNSQSNSHNPGFRYHSSIHDVSHSTSNT